MGASSCKSSKTESISISLEGDLISALDHVVFIRDTSRSAFIRAAVKQAIALELSKDPSFWSRVYYGCANDASQKKIF